MNWLPHYEIVYIGEKRTYLPGIKDTHFSHQTIKRFVVRSFSKEYAISKLLIPVYGDNSLTVRRLPSHWDRLITTYQAFFNYPKQDEPRG